MTTALADLRVELNHLTVSGRSLRVAHRPATNGRPPLLVMNGSRCSIEILTPFFAALDPGTGIVCFDPPGIGGSPRPARPYCLSQLAGAAAGILDELAIPQVDVLGVSWGGALAQLFAFRHRRRVRRLVLVSTGAAPLVWPSLTNVREFLAPRRFHPIHGREIAGRLWGGKVRTDPDLLDCFRPQVTNDGGERYQVLAVLGWTSLPYIRLIRQPTLVVHGSEDGLVPPLNARILAGLLPDARTHYVEDGHLALITSADEIGPVVERFREETP